MKTHSRIRSWRLAAGLTQEELCLRLQISQSTLSGIERGHHRLTVELARRIADICNAPPLEWAALRFPLEDQ